MRDFFNSPFSPIMPNLAAGRSAGFLWKRDSLQNIIVTVSSETSCLLETVSLLNRCICEENQGRLENGKELKILGKDFKKQIKEKSPLL